MFLRNNIFPNGLFITRASRSSEKKRRWKNTQMKQGGTFDAISL